MTLAGWNCDEAADIPKPDLCQQSFDQMSSSDAEEWRQNLVLWDPLEIGSKFDKLSD